MVEINNFNKTARYTISQQCISVGQTVGSELKIAELILAPSGWSLTHIRASKLKLAPFMTWVPGPEEMMN